MNNNDMPKQMMSGYASEYIEKKWYICLIKDLFSLREEAICQKRQGDCRS